MAKPSFLKRLIGELKARYAIPKKYYYGHYKVQWLILKAYADIGEVVSSSSKGRTVNPYPINLRAARAYVRRRVEKFYGLASKTYKPNGKRECARRIRQHQALLMKV